MCTPTSMGTRVSQRIALNDLSPPIPSGISCAPFYSSQAGCQMPEVNLARAPPFHLVEGRIRRTQKLLDGCPVRRIYRLTDADGDERFLAVQRELFADARRGLLGVVPACFWKHQSKLVAAESRWGVNRPAAVAQHVSQ